MVLSKRRRLIGLVLISLLGIGVYLTFSATRLYTASATIKIEPQNPTVTGIAEMFPSQAGSGALAYDYHQTQFALLESRMLAAIVIHDLKLQSNPVFTNTPVISSNPLHRISSTVIGFLQIFGSYESNSPGEQASRSETEVTEKKVDDHGYQQRRIDPAIDVSPALIRRYRSFLKVIPVPNTRLVEVKLTTPDRQLSQQLANAHVASFIRMNLESRFELTSEARDFLDKKNIELKKKLEHSEAALNRFRQVHGVVSLDKGENVVVDRLVELNRSLTTARAQRIEAESLHRTVANRDSQYFSQVAKEGLLPVLRGNLSSLEAERTKLSVTLKPNHPGMLELNQQISEARKAINHETANVVKGIEDNYAAAVAKEKALQAETDRQQQKALNLKQVGVEYAVLEEEVKVNRALYESVLKRFSETSVANDLTVSNMRIVERAEKPRSPVSPNVALNLLLSACFGLFVGAGLAFFLEYFDYSVSTPQRVWQSVGLSTFGVVPDLNSLDRRLFSRHRTAMPPLVEASKYLIVSHNPVSVIGEFYRTIRTALLFSQPEKPPQVILFTSPSQAEGKTSTTLNLAIALAQEGHRVLIIDADLRRGSCHARLGMKNHAGLANILTGNHSIEKAIQPTSVRGLFLLPRGVCPPNPSDLLGSQRMRQIINDVRKSFEFILIDSPPAIAVTDAALISLVCDGVLLVLNGHKTTTALTRQAVERLDAVRASVLGVILNRVDLRNPEYAYYRSYYGSDYGTEGRHRNEAETIAVAENTTEIANDQPRLKERKSPTVLADLLNDEITKPTDAADRSDTLLEQQFEFGQSQPCGESGDQLDKQRNVDCASHNGKLPPSTQQPLASLSHTDPPVKEICVGDLGSRNVPPAFFDHMTSALRDAMGPAAPIVVRDQIERLGGSLESFPMARLKELVEVICTEIHNQTLKTDFEQAMSSEIGSL